MNKILKILYFFLVLFIISCVRMPDAPIDYYSPTTTNKGALILCEGLWGADNASLCKYDNNSDVFTTNYYTKSNPSLILGDIANDITIKGDTAYIVMTTACIIEAVQVSTGKSIGRMFFKSNKALRRLCILNDTTAYVTDLYMNSITEFNPKTFIIKEKYNVGFYPEGIVANGNNIFIANSGLGDYYPNDSKAGTISIFDNLTKTEISRIYAGPDCVELLINKKYNKLYSIYYNLPSLKDSLGGIVEYDLTSLSELRRWRVNAMSASFSPNYDSLYFVNDNNISAIDLIKSNSKANKIITNTNTNDVWYSISISPFDNSLWVANAKDYQSQGEILIFKSNNDSIRLYKKFGTGVIPNKIIFF